VYPRPSPARDRPDASELRLLARRSGFQFDESFAAHADLKTHAGFASAVGNPDWHRMLLEALADEGAGCERLVLTGHSLGGAVAQAVRTRMHT